MLFIHFYIVYIAWELLEISTLYILYYVILFLHVHGNFLIDKQHFCLESKTSVFSALFVVYLFFNLPFGVN